MSDLRDLARRPAPWLVEEGAAEDEVVLSSRVRLARNVTGWRFPHAVEADELCRLREEVVEAVRDASPGACERILPMEDLEETERRFLLERHLISADLVRFVLGRGLVVSEDESLGLMLNEEDHVRLQVFSAGLSVEAALERATTEMRSISERVAFARDDDLGFLTACPTNVGTGMRASILVHLPALVINGDAEPVLNGLRRLNYTVRGFYGEGSGVMGSLFQVSNSATLGREESAIVEELLVHVRKVIECEREARSALVERDPIRTEDRVWRAWGILTRARLLTTREAFELLSDLRLGSSLGLLPRVPTSVSNHLLLCVQSAHLQVGAGQALQAPERDEARARFVREQLDRAEERNDE